MKSNKKNVLYFLDKYERWNKDAINRFLNLNSRWAVIDKSTPEHIVLYEKGAYVI